MSIIDQLGQYISEVGGPHFTDVPVNPKEEAAPNPSTTPSVDELSVFEVNPKYAGGPERLFVTTTADKKTVEEALANLKEESGMGAVGISSALAGMGHWNTIGHWGGQINMTDFGQRKYSDATRIE